MESDGPIEERVVVPLDAQSDALAALSDALNEADDADERARDVLAKIREHLHLLTFNPNAPVFPRAIAAAGLARSLALVDAIDILEENGRGDVAGALARLALEVHHLSLYALLGGEEAVEVMWKDHALHAKRLVGANPELWHAEAEDVSEMVAAWGDGEPLRFQALRGRVESLLHDAGEKDADFEPMLRSSPQQVSH